MEAGTVPQIEKRQYKNNTGGYLGVVVLDPNGNERGVNVDPYGTIWLSDAEAILTARAPQRAEDNPFEEQVFIVQDPETQMRREVRVRPLELVHGGDRYTPAQDRYVPHIMEAGDVDAARMAHVEQAAKADEPANVTAGEAVAERSAEVMANASRPVQRERAPREVPVAMPKSTGSQTPDHTPPPPRADAVPLAPSAPPVRHEPPAAPPQAPPALAGREDPPEAATEPQSWTGEPEAPGQVLSGSLSGSDEPAPGPTASDPTMPQPGDTVAQHGPPNATVTPPGAVPQPRTEEHAQAVDPAVGEETGQARPPAGAAPEGEYASREEVGSPDAAAVEEDEGLIG